MPATPAKLRVVLLLQALQAWNQGTLLLHICSRCSLPNDASGLLLCTRRDCWLPASGPSLS